jgi:hypothetical protein
MVTSSEAIICKRWLTQVHDELCSRFRYGWNGDVVIVLWIHDELVCCCRPEIAEQVGKIMVQHAKEAGEFYCFKVPLDASYKIGLSWAGEPVENDTSSPVKAECPARGPFEGPVQAPTSSDALWDDIEHIRDLYDAPPAAAATVAATNVESSFVPSSITSIALADVIGQQLTDGKIRCPFHDDSTPSLEIYNDHFHCFGCGAHGDAISWLTEAEGLSHQQAIEALTKWEGSRARPQNHGDARVTVERALRLWAEAQPIASTLAARYLREHRHIDLTTLPASLDDVLRFHPRCLFNGACLPCLIALFRDVESNAPAGIHRVALSPNGQKIERRMLGQWPTPRAIKLWPVESTLVIGEGIETVLAAATRIMHRDAPLRPAWITGSSRGIKCFPIIPGVECLIILVDHDVNGVGPDSARACAARWVAAGRKVVLLTPQRSGADFNDIAAESARHEMHAH